MMHRLKDVLKIAIVTALSLAVVEIAIAIVNPLGISYYRDSQAMQLESRLPDPTGYTFAPNKTMQMSHWSYTTDEHGRRIVPGSVEGGIPVQFYGDSVTFCHGVDDDECWVSLVAKQLGLEAVNYGRGSYAAMNVEALMDATAVGCAVFLTIHNDAEILGNMAGGTYRYRPWIELLYHFLGTVLSNRADRESDWDAFYASMTRISQRPDTLILAFTHEYGAMVRDRYGAVLLPPYPAHHRISVADSHANPEGNREIAAAAASLIADWLVGRDCR